MSTFRFQVGDKVYDKVTDDDAVVLGRHAHGRQRLYSVQFRKRQTARIVHQARLVERRG